MEMWHSTSCVVYVWGNSWKEQQTLFACTEESRRSINDLSCTDVKKGKVVDSKTKTIALFFVCLYWPLHQCLSVTHICWFSVYLFRIYIISHYFVIWQHPYRLVRNKESTFILFLMSGTITHSWQRAFVYFLIFCLRQIFECTKRSLLSFSTYAKRYKNILLPFEVCLILYTAIYIEEWERKT